MVPGQVKGKPDQAPHPVQTQMCSSVALKDQTVQGSDLQEVLSPPRPRPNHGTRCLLSRQFLEPASDPAGLPRRTPGSAQCRGSDVMPAGGSTTGAVPSEAGRTQLRSLSGHLAPAPTSVLVPRCHPLSSSLAKWDRLLSLKETSKNGREAQKNTRTRVSGHERTESSFPVWGRKAPVPHEVQREKALLNRKTL